MDRFTDFCSRKSDPMLFTRVSRLLATSRSVDEVLQRILEEAIWVTDAVRGFLAIADYERGELDVRYVAGEGWNPEAQIKRLKVSEETGRGITSHVASTGLPYISGNVSKDQYYMKHFEDVKSEIAVPLLDTHKNTLGVMNIESLKLNAFEDGHLCTLTGLADLATVALTLYEHRTRESALIEIGKELNTVSDTDEILQKVINVAAEALNFEDCSLFLLDEIRNKLILRASRGSLRQQISEAAYDIGEGLTGWTAQQNKPVRIIDPTKDPRWRGLHQEIPSSAVGAFMAVPINGRNGVTGVLRVQRKKSPYKWFPNAFTINDERILSTISIQLGIALDNARLIDQLVKTERMAAWGELSARSAHMMGNRVFAIKGDINELEYILSSAHIKKEDALEITESIKKGFYLLEEILVEFREFVKSTQLDIEDVDINKLISETVGDSFPKRSAVKLEVKLGAKLPILKADPRKLKRGFSELLENSISFMPDGGTIKISTSKADAKAKQALRLGNRSGNYIIIKFEDNGPGVPEDQKSKIFIPFFTSRAKGMGLGLSIVKGIVDAHRGIIFENGKLGKSARFNIFLPVENETEF